MDSLLGTRKNRERERAIECASPTERHVAHIRDELVLGECRRRDVPVVVVFGGGYAQEVQQTVEIHLNTCRVARSLCGVS